MVFSGAERVHKRLLVMERKDKFVRLNSQRTLLTGMSLYLNGNNKLFSDGVREGARG